MKVTLAQLQHTLDTLDNGVLSYGMHEEGDGLFCALECLSKTRSKSEPVTDSPSAERVNTVDIRSLNDMFGMGLEADRLRTIHVLPIVAELSDWSVWSRKRQKRFIEHVIVETVKQIIAELPGLPKDIQNQCRAVNNLAAARSAAYAARSAVAAAARSAAHLKICIVTCNLWMKAAKDSENLK